MFGNGRYRTSSQNHHCEYTLKGDSTSTGTCLLSSVLLVLLHHVSEVWEPLCKSFVVDLHSSRAFDRDREHPATRWRMRVTFIVLWAVFVRVSQTCYSFRIHRGHFGRISALIDGHLLSIIWNVTLPLNRLSGSVTVNICFSNNSYAQVKT